MKNNLLLILLSSFSTFCFAQKSNLYIKGGLNLSNISSINQSNFDDTKTITTFHAGVLASIPIRSTVFVQPGLFISQKGSKMIFGQPSDATYFDMTAKPVYLELPISLVSTIPMQNPNISFYVGGGLYGALGIGGNNKGVYKVSGATVNVDKKIEFSKDATTSPDYDAWAGLGYMKAFDVGFISSAGMLAGRFRISLEYSFGFVPVAREKETDDKNRNRVFSIGVGYRIL
jgi:hypothetical protein